MNKEEVKAAFLKRRALSESTLRTYIPLITSLYNKMDGTDDIAFFKDNTNEVCKYLEKKDKAQSIKTYASALYVLTGDKKYSDLMTKYNKIVLENYKQRKDKPEREKQRKSFAEIQEINATLLANYKKEQTLENLTNALIAVLMTGEYVEPRRLMDWCDMKIRNIDKKKDNYVTVKQFVFNKFKTVKKTGTQSVDIPAKVKTFINKVKKTYPSDEYLLVNVKGKKFTQQALYKRVFTLYGMSVDMLRSVYTTDVTFSDDALKKLEKTAKNMGSSVQMLMGVYTKDNNEVGEADSE